MGQPVKGSADYYQENDWNVICSMCGRKMKASQAVKNWQGLYRHPWHDEPRQPQDFARGVTDRMDVPFSQHPPDNVRLVCTLNGSSGMPGIGIPGCMTPGRTLVFLDPMFDTDMPSLYAESAIPSVGIVGWIIPGNDLGAQ